MMNVKVILLLTVAAVIGLSSSKSMVHLYNQFQTDTSECGVVPLKTFDESIMPRSRLEEVGVAVFHQFNLMSGCGYRSSHYGMYP